jgi:hypothetical protein
MATGLRRTTTQQRKDEQKLRDYGELEANYSVERATELGCIVEDEEGNLQRRRLLWEGSCGRVQESKQVCHARGVVAAMVRDLEDGKDAEHDTCRPHRHSVILDADGLPTEEVHVSFAHPCAYWEVSKDDGETWVAAERLNDDELDELAEESPIVQLIMLTVTTHKDSGNGEDLKPTLTEWGAGINEYRSEWDELREEALTYGDPRASATPTATATPAERKTRQEQWALREHGPALIEELKSVEKGSAQKGEKWAKAKFQKCMISLRVTSPSLHEQLKRCRVGTRHKGSAAKAREIC